MNSVRARILSFLFTTVFPVPGTAPGTQLELNEYLMAREWVLQMRKLSLGEREWFA